MHKIIQTTPPGNNLFYTNKPSHFRMNLIYMVNFRAVARVEHASQGSPSANSKPAGSTLHLTRFLKSEKLCQDMHCRYGVMKIYNGDVNWWKGSIFFNVNSFIYSAYEYVQQALSFTSGVACRIFGESPHSGVYIPDYYDPNNSQAASRVTINSLELHVMSDLHCTTATLWENNIVMPQWIPWDFCIVGTLHFIAFAVKLGERYNSCNFVCMVILRCIFMIFFICNSIKEIRRFK